MQIRSWNLLALCCASGSAWSQPVPDHPLTWGNGQTQLVLSGTFDIGYTSRWDGGGSVADRGRDGTVQSAAGAGGTRVALDFTHALGQETRFLASLEYGINADSDRNAGSGGDMAYFRHGYLGVSGPLGILLFGTLDGARATVIKTYDPFSGYSVASWGSIQQLTTRADNAVAYVTPAWNGLQITLAYTPDLFGNHDPAVRSPVYAVKLDYAHGGLALSYDHEEEWWNAVPGFTRLTLNLVAGSYDFGPVKVMGFYEHTDMAKPFAVAALGFYDDHDGYGLGATMPVGASGLVKVGWSRRDSKTIDNRCDKYGVGYTHQLAARASVYADYARIENGAAGSCAIAYSNEQTSNDLGIGDAGGYGTQGVDLGFVYRF